MPKELAFGVLYVSEEFGAAAHLCACGCGAKIRTPLAPTERRLEETAEGPSLRPSIGSWQQKCQSHYFIHRGKIIWAERWSAEQIAAGWEQEVRNRKLYYKSLYPVEMSLFRRACEWIKKFLP